MLKRVWPHDIELRPAWECPCHWQKNIIICNKKPIQWFKCGQNIAWWCSSNKFWTIVQSSCDFCNWKTAYFSALWDNIIILVSKLSTLWDKILIHLTKFSTLWDKIVIHLTKISTRRQNCHPQQIFMKIFGTLENLNFKKNSFCKADPRCGSNFVQCIYIGV